MSKFSSVKFPSGNIVVAVSGGVDSMVLLDLIISNVPKKNIFVAHFNHQLRGVDADNDQKFVRDFCQKNDIKFFTKNADIFNISNQEKQSIETTARKYRYNFLIDVCYNVDSQNILTAHHLDDRIETALFNLIRGTKLSGLTSLKYSEKYIFDNKEINIVRPLISLTKSDILTYASQKNIDFREDCTNSDNQIQRNFLRNKILPNFAKINPNYQKSIQNFLDYVDELSSIQKQNSQNFIKNQTNKFSNILQKYDFAEDVFSISDFSLLDNLSQKNIIQFLFRKKNFGNIGLSDGLFDEIIRFILDGKNSFGQKNIKNLFLQRRGNWILIIKNPDNTGHN